MRFGGNALGVRNLNTLPTAVKLPVVEGTANIVAFYCTAITQVRTEVRTIGIDNMGQTVLAAIDNKLLTQILNRLYITRCQVFGF